MLPFIAVWRIQRFVIPTEKLLSPVVMKMNAAMAAFHSRAIPTALGKSTRFGHVGDARSTSDFDLVAHCRNRVM
jgi:hypothetical protein